MYILKDHSQRTIYHLRDIPNLSLVIVNLYSFIDLPILISFRSTYYFVRRWYRIKCLLCLLADGKLNSHNSHSNMILGGTGLQRFLGLDLDLASPSP